MSPRNMSSNSTNNSVTSPPATLSTPLAYSYLLRVAFGIIALEAFVSNGLLCVVILKNRKMLRSAYNLLIFSLAVTDLLTGNFKFEVFTFGSFFCKAVKVAFHTMFIYICH